MRITSLYYYVAVGVMRQWCNTTVVGNKMLPMQCVHVWADHVG